MARMGPLGAGTGALAVLAPIVERGLAPELLPGYVALVVARANQADMAVSAGLAAAATSPALRAAIGATRDLAIALAMGHQIERLSAALADLHGLGRDRALADAARAIATPVAGAAAWAKLAAALRAADGRRRSRQAAGRAGDRARRPRPVSGRRDAGTAAAAGRDRAGRGGPPDRAPARGPPHVPDDAELAERLLALLPRAPGSPDLRRSRPRRRRCLAALRDALRRARRAARRRTGRGVARGPRDLRPRADQPGRARRRARRR
jgi:hypothetical protein